MPVLGFLCLGAFRPQTAARGTGNDRGILGRTLPESVNHPAACPGGYASDLWVSQFLRKIEESMTTDFAHGSVSQ